MAINLGDLFISSTYSALARISGGGDVIAKVVALFADSTRRIISGQSEEIRLTRQTNIEPTTYHRIARGKSGILMALPVVSALTIAGSETEVIGNVRLAMENLGVAYQIQDDLSDLFGCKDGRPAGVDLREGRMSLPIIYYLSGATGSDLRSIESILESDKKMDRSECHLWLNRIRASHATRLCHEDIRLFLQMAAKYLELVPPALRRTLEMGTEMVTNAMEDKIQSMDCYPAN
jgi:geranylgeranyl pyrophosphate synthase